VRYEIPILENFENPLPVKSKMADSGSIAKVATVFHPLALPFVV